MSTGCRVWVALLPFLAGCGILIGNVKPAERKARDYEVADLSRTDHWLRLGDDAYGDEAYELAGGGATIAVHSSCGPSGTGRAPSSDVLVTRLRAQSDELARGMIDVTLKHTRARRVARVPALENTVVGTFIVGHDHWGPVVMQNVVFQRAPCSYALIGVSEPRSFPTAQEAFSRFVSSFRWRK